MTVLILATERDISADRMVQTLTERDVPVFRADLSWFPQQLRLEAELRNGRWTGQLATRYRKVALEDLRAIWYRNPSSFQFPAAMSRTERQHAQHEAKLGLGGVLAALPVRWVNHPSRHADAGYKPRQLVAATRAGLSVVPTLVTNSPGAVRRFAARSGPDGVVTKMLGASAICEQGGRRVALTQRLTDTDLDDLHGVDPGLRVDGNDVLACLAVTRKAMQAAREGQGPTLIEAYTYRMGAHTTTDDPTRYRLASELETWRLRDPIERVRAYLARSGQADTAFFEGVEAEAAELGARIRAACRELPDPLPMAVFDHVYTGANAILDAERADYEAYLDGFEEAAR